MESLDDLARVGKMMESRRVEEEEEEEQEDDDDDDEMKIMDHHRHLHRLLHFLRAMVTNFRKNLKPGMRLKSE